MPSKRVDPFRVKRTAVGCALAFLFSVVTHAVVYMTPLEYARTAFGASVPKSKVVWLEGRIAEQVKAILGHEYPQLRVRYWRQGDRSVWILKEIGKEEYITVGITVANGAIADVRVLEYRESRGDEVRHKFFTKQFDGAYLTEDHQLSKHIDGITGATLSVQALIKVSKMALLLDQVTRQKP